MLLHGARVFLGVGDLNAHGPEDTSVLRLWAELGEPAVEFGPMRLHTRHRAAGAELQIGIMRGEVHGRPRLASLDDDRAALRRGQRGQRAADAVVFALEVKQMHLFRMAENALFAVKYDGVGLDAVPERAADTKMLLRALVAHVVLDHLLVAVVCRLVLRNREVTAFQAMRPLVTWSSPLNTRAIWNGW